MSNSKKRAEGRTPSRAVQTVKRRAKASPQSETMERNQERLPLDRLLELEELTVEKFLELEAQAKEKARAGHLSIRDTITKLAKALPEKIDQKAEIERGKRPVKTGKINALPVRGSRILRYRNVSGKIDYAWRLPDHPEELDAVFKARQDELKAQERASEAHKAGSAKRLGIARELVLFWLTGSNKMPVLDPDGKLIKGNSEQDCSLTQQRINELVKSWSGTAAKIYRIAHDPHHDDRARYRKFTAWINDQKEPISKATFIDWISKDLKPSLIKLLT